MMWIVLALLIMGIFASFASFFLKKSTERGINIRRLVASPYLYLGGGLYVFSAVLNIYLLKRMPYSVVVPLGALTYVWTLLISYRFLGEPVTKIKVGGTLMILLGVTLVAVAQR